MKNTLKSKTQDKVPRTKYFRKSPNKMAIDLFSPSTVRKCSYDFLKIRFETLLRHKAKTPQDLEYFLGMSRSYVNEMINGKLIPTLDVRIKVAKFFKTDTLTIWAVPHTERRPRG